MYTEGYWPPRLTFIGPLLCMIDSFLIVINRESLYDSTEKANDVIRKISFSKPLTRLSAKMEKEVASAINSSGHEVRKQKLDRASPGVCRKRIKIGP